MAKISFWILAVLGALACSTPKPEPRIASSAGEQSYAVDYPAALQSLANRYATGEGTVKRVSSELADKR